MEKRIYGVEIEYGIIFSSQGRNVLPVEKIVRYLFERLVTTEGFLNVFLENGARLYQDTGYHPEYASPECSNPIDLLRYEKAGDYILNSLGRDAERTLQREGIRGTLNIYKNNTDFIGNSYGCHENYLVDRHADFYYLAEQFIPFLVTRQIYAGAGKIICDERHGARYSLSQRAESICQKISGTTTNDRSIINTRDEPHADEENYRRLHVIVGDSNMSEFSTYLKIGSASLVLRMIEDGFVKKDFSLRNPVKAVREISEDITCLRKVKLNNGKKMSALDIQKEYFDLALRYMNSRQLSPMEIDIIQKWGYVLNTLEKDPFQLDRELDWVIKYKLLEEYMQKHHVSWTNMDEKVLMLDLQYHDIKTEKGLYYILERNEMVERILTDREIQDAVTMPPQDTRAKIRGEFIKLAREKKIHYNLDWSYIRVGNLLDVRIMCDDPFQTENRRVTDLMRILEKSRPVRRRFRFY
ncbi:Pup--protein ligase [candidate division KSB3 bacterium]|uniref:Pup--protein ligase n=1 Tax=candidate division KSB3 bacterium TaxID=2044937 RepID=A0A2G6E8B8_9BACT|nr:MAG: Pup--protein ligase [candidate division KSB3 bacterium]PIE30635.1 MAG: Pup--protein ligase [candidate division KSB3 bacterium]